jgi:hypothetical protein
MSFVLSLILSLAFAAGSVPQTASNSTSAKGPQSWDAKSIQWQDIDTDGTKYAFFIPAGYHEHHWHNSDARVAVIQGALKVSFGETLDLEHMTAYPVGSFLLVPASAKHTMGADVDTIIIGTAMGPWATHRHGEHHH